MTMIEMIKAHKKILLYLFSAAFLVRTLYLVTVMAAIDQRVLLRDYEYGVIANSLIKGEGYSVPLIEFNENGEVIKNLDRYRPTAYHLPFYPIMLATIYYFADSPFSKYVVMWIQAVFGSATCLILYLVVFRFFANKKTAVIAGCAMIVYPTFIIHVSSLVPETMLIFWFSMLLLYLLSLRNAPTFRTSFITGIFLGVSVLTSNVIVPIIPIIFIWLFMSLNLLKKTKCCMIFVLFCSMSLLIFPLLIRNYIVFNEFPLMKSTAGTNLWLGNNPQASGTFYLHTGEKVSTILPKAFVEGQNLSETVQDQLLYDKAMAYIKSDPLHFIKLCLIKLYYFLWFPPDHLISKETRILKKIVMIPYAVMIASCIIGILLSLKKYPKEVFLVCSIICSVMLLYAIFIVGHPRYRMTIEPYMIIFSSYALNAWIDKYTIMKRCG